MTERRSEQSVPDESKDYAEANARKQTFDRTERIGVVSSDENVAKLQLSARWSEEHAPASGDTLDAALARFQRAYKYIDSVTKLIEPESD